MNARLTTLALALFAASASAQAPEFIHYTFDAGDATNSAVPGVGNGTPGPGSVFTSGTFCGGSGAFGVVSGAGDRRINSGWVPVLSGDWTIGCWLDFTAGGNGFQYVWGDGTPAGGIRCFANGAAGAGNMALRGPVTDMNVPGGAPAGPVHLVFVHDDTADEIRAYVDGTLALTVAQTSIVNLTANFFVGGNNSTSSGMAPGNLIDDFRFYSRVISPAELSAWVNSCGTGAYTDSCNGDGGDQLGCSDCPCGNNAVAGTVGGCLNSDLRSARLLASGTASVAADTLHFDMSGGTSNSFAVLTSGDAIAPTSMASPCFGLNSGVTSAFFDGLRCAVQGVLRHGARPIDAAGDVGLTTNGWGPPNAPVSGILAQSGFVAGQTRHFQVIYRENPALACLTGQNTSQAVSVTVLP